MRDTFGLVPPALKAQIDNEEAVDRQIGTARWLDGELKASDPYLGLVFIRPGVPEPELPLGAKAGRWHVERKNPGFVSSYYPITGPNGEFREPHGGILEELAGRDLWRRGTMEDTLRRTTNRREKDALADEQRRDQVAEDLRAGKRVAGEGGLTKRKWGRG